MLIRNRIMRNPVTVTSQDTLATAQEKMTVGRSRHLPGVVEEGRADLSAATKLVNELGGEVLGVGSHRIPWENKQVFYLRMRGADPAAVSAGLQRRGYTVLGIH